jgi:hypothetical protein
LVVHGIVVAVGLAVRDAVGDAWGRALHICDSEASVNAMLGNSCIVSFVRVSMALVLEIMQRIYGIECLELMSTSIGIEDIVPK